MMADATDEVNAARAQVCAGLRVEEPQDQVKPPPMVDLEASQIAQPPKAERLNSLPRRSEVNVYITQRAPADLGDDPAAAKQLTGIKELPNLVRPRRRGSLIAASVKLADLPALAEHPSVVAVEFAEPLKAPKPRLGSGTVAAPDPKDRRLDDGGGERILIGIVDVQGFDFAHEDFLTDGGNTRFLRIWDQAGTRRSSPEPFRYGSELTQKHLNDALKEGKRQRIQATAYEPQSSMDDGSHGTHVASIAAGNRGVCHKAEIVAVLLALGQSDEDRRRSFYDSTRLADAVDYLIRVAEELGRPISINVSLGTNGHAHDGRSAITRWIDSALAVPGRAVCVAAGNAGQESPENEKDFGYIVGRIHTGGRVPAKDLTVDLDWLVMGSGLVDISENELELWYSPADRFAVSIRPPGRDWTEIIEPGEYIENRQLPDGSFLSVYNEFYHPANGANYIAVYLSPFFGPSGTKGVPAGTWRVRLHGREVRDGRFHGWIERDDPVRIGGGSYWAFPSFFAATSNVDKSSISSLACGESVMAVANYDARRDKINISSSQGPTRDGRSKPEIAAPGTGIVAARGFAESDGNAWIEMSGTSMASPYVAGVVGLMLAKRPSLTAAQILGIIQRTANPFPGFDFTWRDDAGYGRINPAKCLDEIDVFEQRRDRT
jgi:subtilisin family serine protease